MPADAARCAVGAAARSACAPWTGSTTFWCATARSRRSQRRAHDRTGTGVEQVDAEGLTVFPGFVDPHVHLRTPGREDEEDLDSGTRAAAAGGFCCVLAMPNTEPVVDNASVLRSLFERAPLEARRTGRLSRRDHQGPGRQRADRDGGARRRGRGRLHRRRHAGHRRRPAATGPSVPAALRGSCWPCTRRIRPCPGHGVMHEGAVSTLLGLAGIPSISESTMIERDAALALYEGGQLHMLHLSAAESVEAVERARARRREGHGRGDPAPPDPDRRGGALARLALQDESAAARRVATARR